MSTDHRSGPAATVWLTGLPSAGKTTSRGVRTGERASGETMVRAVLSPELWAKIPRRPHAKTSRASGWGGTSTACYVLAAGRVALLGRP